MTATGKPSTLTGSTRLLQLIAGGAALLLICALLYYAVIELRCARDAIAYPFGLDYGEGGVWQQEILIPGPRMYGPIDKSPFIAFEYPPFYYLVVRAVAAFGLDSLAAGRAVSVAATAVLLLCIAWLVGAGLAGRINRSAVVVGVTIGALLPLALHPVEIWFPLMRVDMLALALTFTGVVLFVRAFERPEWLWLAMPAFVLSVYTRQTQFAAPVAALAVLVTVRPRAAVLAGLGGAALGLIPLAYLEWVTAGGFLRHIITYLVNPFTLEHLLYYLNTARPYAPLLFAAAGGIAATWGDKTATRSWAIVRIVTLWLLISVFMLLMLGRSGTSLNYFIESMCVASIGAGWLAGFGWQAVVGDFDGRVTSPRLALIAMAAVMGYWVHRVPPWCATDFVTPEKTAVRESLVREIAAQDKPVLSEDVTLLLKAGRDNPIETAIFTQLALTGAWDQRPFLKLIDDHAFAFVVMEKDEHLRTERYTSDVLEAISRAYPHVETRGDFIIRRPESP